MLRMHLGHSDEPPLIAPQRWGAIEGGLVLQFVDPQQGGISLAVADPGEGPGEPTPAPLSFRPKKNFFGDRSLKVWIQHCLVLS